MSLSEAVAVAAESECGENLILDCMCPPWYVMKANGCSSICPPGFIDCLTPLTACEKLDYRNEETGTVWINLNMTKPGCSPACVITIATRTAEINWRCTGLIAP